jgi:hypothetical protein
MKKVEQFTLLSKTELPSHPYQFFLKSLHLKLPVYLFMSLQ